MKRISDKTKKQLIHLYTQTNTSVVVISSVLDISIKTIYKILSKTMLKPISEIAPYVPFGKSKATQLLKDLGQKGVVKVEGKGRGTKYIIK